VRGHDTAHDSLGESRVTTRFSGVICRKPGSCQHVARQDFAPHVRSPVVPSVCPRDAPRAPVDPPAWHATWQVRLTWPARRPHHRALDPYVCLAIAPLPLVLLKPGLVCESSGRPCCGRRQFLVCLGWHDRKLTERSPANAVAIAVLTSQAVFPPFLLLHVYGKFLGASGGTIARATVSVAMAGADLPTPNAGADGPANLWIHVLFLCKVAGQRLADPSAYHDSLWQKQKSDVRVGVAMAGAELAAATAGQLSKQVFIQQSHQPLLQHVCIATSTGSEQTCWQHQPPAGVSAALQHVLQ
jgi:hypothetical protein